MNREDIYQKWLEYAREAELTQYERDLIREHWIVAFARGIIQERNK